jgi:hypothetical protein
MEARFLKSVNWNGILFEAGKTYWLDPMVYAKLLRQHIIEPVKESEPEKAESVESKEIPEQVEFEPVVTDFEPLPKKPQVKRPAAKTKPKGRK